MTTPREEREQFLDFEVRTPWQIDRDEAERTGKFPEAWGPHHRHFANDAIHRDGGSECDQPGTPRRVWVFDSDNLDQHERAVAVHAIDVDRAERSSSWHLFNKDDSTTWPEKIDELYWVVVPDGDKQLVVRDRFIIVQHWPNVTHWMEITVPEAPSTSSTEEKDQ